MNNILWILFCLLASAGAVHVAGWIVRNARRPRGIRRGYHIIPLYEGPEQIEAQLRFCLSRIHWGDHGGEVVLLVDMGLCKESLAICKEMMERYSLLYCRKDQLLETLKRLDEMQRI